jgi:DNA-binding PadR family transcriptional regulator
MTSSLDTVAHYHHNVMVNVLGEFEYLMLTEIENATAERCSIGALYTTLDRLEGKGLIKAWMGDPTPQRGGRPKRMVRVTASGTRAASVFWASELRVSRRVSWDLVR